jgi:hypothetical protein
MTVKAQTDAEKLRAEHPNSWIAIEEGDQLVGVVAEVTMAWSDARAKGNNGDGFYPLVRVDTGDGIILAFHAFSVVSYNEIMEKQPIPGERIVVTYQGLGKKKEDQNAPKIFHVNVQGRDPIKMAANVYSQMQRRSGGMPPVTALPPVEADAPAETSDLPF